MSGNQSFGDMLLAWYDEHARDLPWREDRDPYRVWVSEVMLQQTRVAAVVEYYRKFLKKFPTVQKLAAAREASVLAAWSGLGYYRRARMLHAAAKMIVRDGGGRFPETVEGLRELPGVGRYTAAAIASIAFGKRAAVVDGNVERVLSRVSGKPIAGEAVWQSAQELLDASSLSSQRPGDFNQAMMELGATVCAPGAPKCLLCPLPALCATRGELPATKAAGRQRKCEVVYALARKDRAIAMVQRGHNLSLMPGMWELPAVSQPNGHKPLFTLRHSITVTDYTVRVVEAGETTEGQWVATQRLATLPLTGLARKILRRSGLI